LNIIGVSIWKFNVLEFYHDFNLISNFCKFPIIFLPTVLSMFEVSLLTSMARIASVSFDGSIAWVGCFARFLSLSL
jgi:hypothetical protein